MAGEEGPVREFSFLKGAENIVASKDGSAFQWNASATRVRENLYDALNAKNLAFLFAQAAPRLFTEVRRRGSRLWGRSLLNS